MADIQPLRALHYDLEKVGPLDKVISPPYDIIDGRQRAALAALSPYNVVSVDMPQASGDPYVDAASTFTQWQHDGAVVHDKEDAFWILEQQYVAPDGSRSTRRGFFARVRIEDYESGKIRPHERTHPGPMEDRLKLTRATKTNLSPIFSLFDDQAGGVWKALDSFTDSKPWAEFASSEGLADSNATKNLLWRVTDQDAITSVQHAIAESELLIADGHHRYETARTYAHEIGGDGAHNYVLMLLVALQDPGLTIFPTHRLLFDLDNEQRSALRSAIERDWIATPVPIEELDGASADGNSSNPNNKNVPQTQIGYLDNDGRSLILTLREGAAENNNIFKEKPTAYRQLDTAILEALVLKQALGMTDDDIDHNRGLRYARSTVEAIEKVKTGKIEVAFFMRSTPVERIRAIAATGENMPPKTTYFFPKIPTGIVFSSLE